MCECNKYFEPDDKLRRMLVFLWIILGINFVLGILSAIFCSLGMCLYIFIQTIILLCAIKSVLYTYLAMFVFFCLMNGFSMLIFVGIVIQQLIITDHSTLKDSDDKVEFGIQVFTLVFSIFCIFLVFPIYREMKAQLYERVSGMPADPEQGNQRPQQPVSSSNYRAPQVSNNQVNSNPVNNRPQQQPQPSTTSNNRGYVAFGGRGSAVGGN
mmetsp:Transcript_679/g.672  ORF Transcript_679/g.672 Transcript_679/m.672 type:complete len:211 (+) Transcript_679:42-674(+)